ncbi:MAG: MoxR family ATPase [Synechococcales bacterium]|nr:MoxR family ATPase [Synechococcales bacterium]
MSATRQQSYTFTGKPIDPKKRSTQKLHPDVPKQPEPYVLGDGNTELAQAVNLAIHLQRPLLLEGEAGCGKTRLAVAIAYELGLPFYRWDVRSTSKAREGLYEYDALLRLHDVQARQADQNLGRNPADPVDYLRYGALGKAFQLAKFPAVVLIDEIDKADLDFPNDLLTVLEKPWQFEVPEVVIEQEGQKKPMTIGPAIHPPIVIITSNREKQNLPLPFLRRCIYYYVEFPKKEHLLDIIKAHYANESVQPDETLVNAAADRFLTICKTKKLFKNPGTSEFLDWISAMIKFGTVETLLKQLAIAEGETEIKTVPFREVLFKVRHDWNQFQPQ